MNIETLYRYLLRLLTWVAAVVSVVLVASVSIALVLLVGIATSVAFFPFGVVLFIGFYLISCLAAAVSGGAALQISALIFPLRSNGTRRWGVILFLILFVAAVHLGIGSLLGHLRSVAAALSPAERHWENGFQAVEAQVGIAVTVLLYPHLFLIFVVPALVLTRRHHRTMSGFKRAPILFLRRFDGRGDSAALVALYRAKPHGNPLVFLLAPERGWRVWDPYLVGLRSIHIPWVWSEVPYLLIASADWRRDVARLINIAKVIVVDVTELSSGVREELNLIQDLTAQERTVLVRSRSAPSMPNRHAPIEYEELWTASTGRALYLMVGSVSMAAIGTTLFSTGYGTGWLLIACAISVLVFLVSAFSFLRPAPPNTFSDMLRAAIGERLSMEASDNMLRTVAVTKATLAFNSVEKEREETPN